MYNFLSRRLATLVLTSSAVGLAACNSGTSTTATEAATRRPGLAVIGTDPTPEAGKIKVCKAGNINGTFTVTRLGFGGSNIGTVVPSPDIAPGTCMVVAEDASGADMGSNVTITETPATYLTGVTAERIDNGVVTSTTFSNGGTSFLNSFHGYTYTFDNFVPPPPTSTQGCSPGYWKNHNFPAGYTKTQLFASDIPGTDFENAFPGRSFQDVLSAGGGGLTALGRATVGAYFNAVALPATYGLTPAQVVSMFNAAYPNGDYNGLKATFEALQDVNGRICPNPTGR